MNHLALATCSTYIYLYVQENRKINHLALSIVFFFMIQEKRSLSECFCFVSIVIKKQTYTKIQETCLIWARLSDVSAALQIHVILTAARERQWPEISPPRPSDRRNRSQMTTGNQKKHRSQGKFPPRPAGSGQNKNTTLAQRPPQQITADIWKTEEPPQPREISALACGH